MFDFGLFGGGGKGKVDGPTSQPSSATGGEGPDLWGVAGKFFRDAGEGVGKFGDAVGGIFGINKQDPAAAGAAVAAEKAGAVNEDLSSSDGVVTASLQSLPPRPEFGTEPVFERSISRVGQKIESELTKISSPEEEDMGKRAANFVSGAIGLTGTLGGGVVRTAFSVIPGLAGELENLIDTQEERNDQSDDPVDRNNKHLVSTNLEKVVDESSNVLEGPLKMMSELFDPDEDDKVKVLVDNAKEMVKQVGGVLHSTVAVGAGILGFDINEKIRKADAERRLKEEAEEKARREAEEEAEKAKKKAEEERKIGKDIPEADADDQKKTNKDTDFADKSLEFKSLFYIANDHDGYSRGFDESTRGDSILMRSKFKLNNESVNSVTFFENVNVESWKSGRFYGTQKRTTENGKKEVVFVGDEAFNAQSKMYEEYFENAKKILELKAKVEKYNKDSSDGSRIELGDLCKIDENKDFNFLIKDGGNNNIVNSPLKQRMDKINKKIATIKLPQLNESEKKAIEKEAIYFAKILLVEQVKNNCLYTQDDDDGFKEAKRINIFRGKKDFKTGKSVTEVKFGSSCQTGDFALIPVDQQSGLFCKVSYDEIGKAKIEYFIKKDNELKLIKYDKNLKYADDSDVSNKDKIINVIENHIIEVSWSDKIVNSTKQLDTDMPSAGGDNKGSTTPDDDVDGIKSFGSQSFVIDRQAEYRLKSRNTADWWNNKTRIPCIESFKTKHSDTGFSIEKKSTRLSSTGNKFISTFSLHNDEDENTKQKILASEFEIDVKLDKDNKIIELNTEIDRNKNPNLNEAMKILDGLKIQDGKIQDPSSTHTTKGIDSRFFKKPTGFGMLPDSLSGEVKQGGSMVVNMNVFDNDGNKKSRIRVEFGVHNRGLGLRTTHDRLIIRNFGKTEDSVDKWAKKIKESPRIQCDGSAR